MWQHHYVIHAMRMDALRAEAERERRWRLGDLGQGSPFRSARPGVVRAAVSRLAAAIGRLATAVGRAADRVARRLDGGVEPGTAGIPPRATPS